MMYRFYPSGRSPTDAARYLVAEKDHKGVPRPVVEVLRGDPLAVAEYASSLSFKNKCVSAAISFGHDEPTPEQLDKVMDSFESACFGNLDRSRFSYAFVNHGDHLHFFMAGADLDTGNSFCPNPPTSATRKRFRAMRDALNFEYGWMRPDDPRRARGPEASIVRKARKGPSGASSELAGRVERVIHEKAVQGLLNSRADVVRELGRMGLKVFRSGKTLSVQNPDGGRNVRLKTPAALFSLDFDGDAYRAACARSGGVADEPDPKRAAACWAEFEARSKAWGDHWLSRRRKAPKAALPPAGAALAAPCPGAVAIPVSKDAQMVDPKLFSSFMALFGCVVRDALAPPSPILVADSGTVGARAALPLDRVSRADRIARAKERQGVLMGARRDHEIAWLKRRVELFERVAAMQEQEAAQERKAREAREAQARADRAERDRAEEAERKRAWEARQAEGRARAEAVAKAAAASKPVAEGGGKKGWRPPPPRPF